MYGFMELPNTFARASGRIMGVDVGVLEAIRTTMCRTNMEIRPIERRERTHEEAETDTAAAHSRSGTARIGTKK